MADDTTEVGSGKATFFVKLGYDSIVVHGDDHQDLLARAKEIVENIAEYADMATAMKNAFNITTATKGSAEESDDKKTPATRRGPVTTRQSKTTARTAKPGPRRPPARSEATDELCQCGEPWNDLNGGTTKSGEPYKYRYYNTCGNRDCKPWGENEG